MTGHIKFQYDRLHHIVIVFPAWHIENEQDVHRWYEEYAAYFRSRFADKVDVIFVLDEFSVTPQIAGAWGVVRAKLLKEFTRFSVRVHAEQVTRTFAKTSGILQRASADEAASVPAAIKKILALRTAQQT